MGEAVGSGNHKTAATMVRAADALWDARSGHDPTAAAAMTHLDRSPAPAEGEGGDKRASTVHSKNCPPSNQDFLSFQNPGNGVCKYHSYYNARAHRCVKPCAGSEN
jgi:hypothetical protein